MRRRSVLCGLAAAVSGAAPTQALAGEVSAPNPAAALDQSLAAVQSRVPVMEHPFYRCPRELRLAREGQSMRVEYWRDGSLNVEGYSRLCWMLRDIQGGQLVQMDPGLLEVLRWVQHYARTLGFSAPLQVLSGYRSPRTNTRTEGAARNSMHLYGKAVDFTLPGVSTESLGQVVHYLDRQMRLGGTGVYVRNGFVHADTGGFRAWRGS